MEWACEEQSKERQTWSECSLLIPGGHHPRTTSYWTRLPGRPHHCSLLIPGGWRCPCSKWLNFLEEFYDSAWRSLRMSEERESRPKEKGTPLRGGGFYLWTRPPFFLATCRRKWEWSVQLMWSIEFLSVVNQIPCDRGVLPKHVMGVWEEIININLRFCLLRRPVTKYREI